MSFRRSSIPTIVAAMMLAATSTPIFAQSNPSPDRSTTGDATNEAWSKSDIDSPPPTPNGGMSSGAHRGNESPTSPGISAGDRPLSEEAKKNLERTLSESR